MRLMIFMFGYCRTLDRLEDDGEVNATKEEWAAHQKRAMAQAAREEKKPEEGEPCLSLAASVDMGMAQIPLDRRS